MKVSAFDHESLASSLTTKSAEGWEVVGLVSTTDDHVVAFLSRHLSRQSTASASPASGISGQPVAASPVVHDGPRANSTSTSPSVPADWYKDPAGRFEYRYWDGSKWTEHVSRAGAVHRDPPTP